MRKKINTAEMTPEEVSRALKRARRKFKSIIRLAWTAFSATLAVTLSLLAAEIAKGLENTMTKDMAITMSAMLAVLTWTCIATVSWLLGEHVTDGTQHR